MSVRVAIAEATTTDVATASYSSLGFEPVFMSARVAQDGLALVLFKNEGEKAVDLPPGTLRVVASAFS